jgi:hypothetical protein
VLTDRVRIPHAVSDRYRSIAAGAVFVGARGDVASKNPEGFLRRVTSVVDEQDALVLMTTPATLTDALVRGSVHASSGGSATLDGVETRSVAPLSVRTFRGIEIDYANQPLFDGDDEIVIGGKTTRFHESIRLERAIMSARPVVDVDVKIEGGVVKKLTAKVEGNLDSSVLAHAVVSADGDADAETRAALRAKKHETARVIYQSSRVALPTVSAGGVPISPSVKFKVTLRCSLAFGGALDAHAGVEARAYVRLGGVYAHGAWTAPIRSDFNILPTLTVDRGGELDARCALEADAELYLYGNSGVTMSVAPYVDFSITPAEDHFAFKAGAGATGYMQGTGNVFGLGEPELSRALVEWTAPSLVKGETHE